MTFTKLLEIHDSKLRVGVAGPVGSGKTALVELYAYENNKIAVVTNDIYTKEDANFLINKSFRGRKDYWRETGGCPSDKRGLFKKCSFRFRK